VLFLHELLLYIEAKPISNRTPEMAIVYPRFMQTTKQDTTFLQVVSVESNKLSYGLQRISVYDWYIEKDFIPLKLEIVSQILNERPVLMEAGV
jgi:hypothetical protein